MNVKTIKSIHNRNSWAAIPDVVNAQSWFTIKNVVTQPYAEVWIYDEIGYWGVTATDFIMALQEVSADEIIVHLNSPGGDVFDGIAIYNALRNHPAKIRSQIDSLAASIGSVIALAGDEIIIETTAMMMIHDASGMCYGNATEMQAMADLLNKTSDNIAGIYAARSDRSAEEWREDMRAETWYTGAEAVDAGLCDRTADAGVANAAPERPRASLAGRPPRTEAPVPVAPAPRADGRDASVPDQAADGTIPDNTPWQDLTPELVAAAFDPFMFRTVVENEFREAPAPPVLSPQNERMPSTRPDDPWEFDPIDLINQIKQIGGKAQS